MTMKTRAKMVESASSKIVISGQTYTLVTATENRKTLPKGSSCGNRLSVLPEADSRVTRAARPTPR